MTKDEIQNATFQELRERLDLLVRALLCPSFGEASRIIEAMAKRYEHVRSGRQPQP